MYELAKRIFCSFWGLFYLFAGLGKNTQYLSERYKDDHAQLFGVAELFKSIKKEKPEQAVHEDDYLTYDKVMELSGKATPRLSLIMLALFWTGCRVSELIDMRVEDIKIN